MRKLNYVIAVLLATALAPEAKAQEVEGKLDDQVAVAAVSAPASVSTRSVPTKTGKKTETDNSTIDPLIPYLLDHPNQNLKTAPPNNDFLLPGTNAPEPSIDFDAGANNPLGIQSYTREDLKQLESQFGREFLLELGSAYGNQRYHLLRGSTFYEANLEKLHDPAERDFLRSLGKAGKHTIDMDLFDIDILSIFSDQETTFRITKPKEDGSPEQLIRDALAGNTKTESGSTLSPLGKLAFWKKVTYGGGNILTYGADIKPTTSGVEAQANLGFTFKDAATIEVRQKVDSGLEYRTIFTLKPEFLRNGIFRPELHYVVERDRDNRAIINILKADF